MNIKLFPETTWGNYAFKALLLSVFFFFLLILTTMAGQQGPDFNWFLALPTGLMFLSGISAAGCATYSIVKEKERSVIVLLTAGIGILMLFFIVGEFFFPH